MKKTLRCPSSHKLRLFLIIISCLILFSTIVETQRQFGYNVKHKCPKFPVNRECTCQAGISVFTGDDVYDVICFDIKSGEEFNEIIDAFENDAQAHKYPILLSFHRSKFDHVDVLGKPHSTIQIQELHFLHTQFANMSESALKHLSPNLQILTIIDNSLSPKLQTNNIRALFRAIGFLNNLRQIEISLPDLLDIDMSFFNNFPRLEKLLLIFPSLRIVHHNRMIDLPKLKMFSLVSKLPYVLRGFVSLPKLSYFSYTSNMLRGLGRETLVNASALEELDLSNCQLEYIASGAFESNHKISHLDLSNNHLKWLPPLCTKHSSTEKNEKSNDEKRAATGSSVGRRQSKTSLTPETIDESDVETETPEEKAEEILDLKQSATDNEGGTFDKNDESDNDVDRSNTVSLHLTVLNLGKNFFTGHTLNEYTLAHCNHIKTLYLSDNLLSHIHADFLNSPRHTLRNLHLERNKIKHIPLDVLSKLTNLSNLNMAGNYITRVPHFAFRNNPNLKLLDLTSNRISEFPLSSLEKSHQTIMEIRLAHNQLTEFKFEDLEFFNNITSLDLSFNKITSVKGIVDLSLVTHHIFNINLVGNPIICDCDVYKLIKWYYYESNLVDVPIIQLEATCSNPKHGIREHSLLSHRLMLKLQQLCGEPDENFENQTSPSLIADIFGINKAKKAKQFPVENKSHALSPYHSDDKATYTPKNSQQWKGHLVIVTLSILFAISVLMLFALFVNRYGLTKRTLSNKTNFLLSKFNLGNASNLSSGHRAVWGSGMGSDRIRFVSQEILPAAESMSIQPPSVQNYNTNTTQPSTSNNNSNIKNNKSSQVTTNLSQ